MFSLKCTTKHNTTPVDNISSGVFIIYSEIRLNILCEIAW